ncbi:MAG: hypothetical protein H8F28_23180 [Fibrella sp.]|nr:hypothetical protein [Armatimonadota bacterium]
MQRTFIRPFTDEERRTIAEELTLLQAQSEQDARIMFKYRRTIGAIFGVFVGVFVLLFWELTETLLPIACVYVLLGFAAAGTLLHPLFQKWQTTHDYPARIGCLRRIRDRGQRRVMQVEAIAVAALRYADAEESYDYEAFFCDLGDGKVLCLCDDAVVEAVADEVFPCLRFERLGYPNQEAFDTLVTRSEVIEPLYEYDWAELGNAYIPVDGEILTGISLATLPGDLRRLSNGQ